MGPEVDGEPVGEGVPLLVSVTDGEGLGDVLGDGDDVVGLGLAELLGLADDDVLGAGDVAWQLCDGWADPREVGAGPPSALE